MRSPPPEVAGSSPIGRRFGPYAVVDTIGRGGMGAVHRAVHEQTGAVHALELLQPRVSPDPASIDVTRAMAYLIVLVDRESDRLVAGGQEAYAARWLALDARWRDFHVVLDRERRRRDVPGWALSWIAHTARRTGEGAAESRRESDGELRDALRIDPSRQGARDAFEWLHRLAFERDGELPPYRQSMEVALYYVRYLNGADHLGEPDLAAIRAALARVPAMTRSPTIMFRLPSANRLRRHGGAIALKLIAQDPGEAEPCAVLDRAVEIARLACGPAERPEDVVPEHLAALHAVRHGRFAEGIAALDAHQGSGDPTAGTAGVRIVMAAELIERSRFADARRVLLRSLGVRLVHPSDLRRRADLWRALDEPERAASDEPSAREEAQSDW